MTITATQDFTRWSLYPVTWVARQTLGTGVQRKPLRRERKARLAKGLS